MYSIDSRVRFSEVDADGNLTWLALIDYLQDCTTEQSELLGIGIDYVRERHLAWVLLTWQICVNRMPKLSEKIRIETHPFDLKGFFGQRNFLLKDEQGEILAYANSIWVLIDTRTARPAKIPEEMYEAYELSPKYPMNYFGRKLKNPQDMEEKEAIPVLPWFIDTNHHMNNNKYIMLALSFLPEDFHVEELRAEYRVQAMLGDMLHPMVGMEEDKVTVSINSDEGRPYAIIQFLGHR